LYCFPFALPTTVASMNYNSVILTGVVALSTFWWFVYANQKYEGPAVVKILAEPARRLSKV